MRPPTRRGVVLAAAATLAAGCSPSGPRPDPPDRRDAPSRPATQEDTIRDLDFRVVDRSRPFALLAPGFVALIEEDPAPGRVVSDTGPPAPFATVELALRDASGTSTCGLVSAGGDHLLVRWSGATGRVSLELRTDGRTRTLRRRTLRRIDAGGALGLAFVLCENQVTALVERGDGWEPVVSERDKVRARTDLCDEEVLAGLRYAWSTGDGARAGSVRAGLFGMTGVRDGHLVQHADGTPYEEGGRQFATWTCAGPGFFQQAHWTVWSFDPARPEEQRLEAHLFSRRDGRVLGDHAGQLVRDGGRWLVATSAWGDFTPGSIHVRHTSTTADLLRGVHVLDTEPTPLPTRHGSWDPSLTRVDGTWWVGFVASPSQGPRTRFDFHPAVARTTSDTWHEGLEPVFAAEDLHQCEGPIWVADAGETRLLASDADGRRYPVWGLDGRLHGELTAPYGTNIPHPQLLPRPEGGWWLLTFDGTPYGERVLGYGTHGDRIVMRA